MDIIKWRDSFETGIKSMDEQHQELIKLINTMFRILRKTEEANTMDQILQDMSEYATKHLKDEEQLLQENNYPDYESHAQLHASYIEKIDHLVSIYNKDDEQAAKQIYAFLREWWLNHIMEEDKKYGSFLSEKNIS